MNAVVSNSGISKGVGTKLQAIAGGPVKRRLARWALLTSKIEALESEMVDQSNEQLRKRSLSLGYQAKSAVPLVQLLPEAYALVR